MKRSLLLLLVLVFGFALGVWPRQRPVAAKPPQPALHLPGNEEIKPAFAKWKSPEQAAQELPNLAKALALPAGAAQEEALLLAVLNVPNDQLPAALSLLLPSARGDLAGAIATQWATQNPVEAAAFANSAEGLASLRGAHGGALQMGIMSGLLVTQEAAAVALARRLGSPHAMQNLFNAMMKRDSTRALQWAMQEPGLNMNFLSLTNCDQQLAGELSALPDSRMKRQLLASALSVMQEDAVGDPEKVGPMLDWWRGLNPADQLATLAGNFSDPQNPEWCRKFAEKLSSADLDRLQEAWMKDPGLRNDAKVVQSLAILQGAKDPAAALAWATEQLQGRLRTEAQASILAVSVPGNLTNLTSFLDAIPPGPLRDQAAAAAFERCKHVLPENLVRWAEKRTDPGERKALLAPAISRWADSDPAAAARFLSSEIPSARQSNLTQKVIAKLPSTADQLAFAQRLPESLAATALANAWREDPPDPTVATKAAPSLPQGRLREVLITTASRSIQQSESTETWQAWVQNLPAADRSTALQAGVKSGD